MDDRWPKGSRAPRSGSRAWLLDNRGRQYRINGAVAFHVYFQPTEGKLWNRIYRDGVPLRIPALVSRPDFIAEVGNRDGAYQLQPIDAHERPVGDPPAMVFLPAPRLPATEPRAPSPSVDAVGLDAVGLDAAGLDAVLRTDPDAGDVAIAD